MNILIVDDDSFAAEMTGALLEAMNCSVVYADSGFDALDKIDTIPSVNLIISDMNMPMMSGIELFHMLREQGYQQPFILLTGDDPAPLQAQAPDITACIMKSASLCETLSAAITQINLSQ